MPETARFHVCHHDSAPRNPTAVCVALQQAHLSDGWLPRCWHASLGRHWKRHALLSNLHCQHVRARTDGVGAYDHVYRAAMMEKLHEVPSLQGLLPFVRATCANPTSNVWEDEDGVQHRIVQAEGGEQGDPLMPLLFSLAIHDPLQQAQRNSELTNICSPSWTMCTSLPKPLAALGWLRHKLTAEEDPGGCFQDLRDATAQLDREGFIGRPHWHELRTGIRPRAIVDSEPGECNTSSSEHSFRKNVVLNQSCAADQVLQRL